MLTRSMISEMQQKYSLTEKKEDKSKTELEKQHTRISFSEALEFCQKYISKHATNAYRKEEDPIKKRNMTTEYINEYVDYIKPMVEGIESLQDLK